MNNYHLSQQASKQIQFGEKLSLNKMCPIIQCDRKYNVFTVLKGQKMNQDKNDNKNTINQFALNGQKMEDNMIYKLLQLEQKWITKQFIIKEYVQNLKKTIEEKDIKIQKLNIDNYRLGDKLSKIEQQKDMIFDKLNQIHETMVILQNQTIKNKLEQKNNQENKNNLEHNKKKKKSQLSQNIMISQIYKPINKIGGLNGNRKQLSQQNKQVQNMKDDRFINEIQSKNMQSRILSNLIKIFEQNFSFCPYNESQNSQDKQDQQSFIKRSRQIRITTTTNDTSAQILKNSIIKKNNKSNKKHQQQQKQYIRYKQIQYQRQSQKQQQQNGIRQKQIKKGNKDYKSAKTITFSRQQQTFDNNEIQKQQFYFHNQIRSTFITNSQSQIISKQYTNNQQSKLKNNKQQTKQIYKKQKQIHNKQKQIKNSVNNSIKSNYIQQKNNLQSNDINININKYNGQNKTNQIKQMKQVQSQTNYNKISTQKIQKISGKNIERSNNKRKRQSRKISNLDYSLSSSLISGSDMQQNQFNRNQLYPSIFKLLTHENKLNKRQYSKQRTQNIHIQNIKSNKNNNKNNKILRSQQLNYYQNINKQIIQNNNKEQNIIQNSIKEKNNKYINLNLNQQILSHQIILNNKNNIKSQPIIQISNKNLQLNPTTPNKNKNLQLVTKSLQLQVQNIKHNINNFRNNHKHQSKPQSKPQNHQIKPQNLQYKPQNHQNKNHNQQKQNYQYLENTNHKKPQFHHSNSLDQNYTSSKLYTINNINNQPQKIALFVQQIGPQTKCNSFQDKSNGNTFYFDKSSSSDGPFRKIKFTSQPLDNQQEKNKYNKLSFENQILKSYNNTLQKQTKKQSKTQKLMEKFNSQNISILNKINKKSIS